MWKRVGSAVAIGALVVMVAFGFSATEIRPLQLAAFFVIEPPMVLIGSAVGSGGAVFAFFSAWLAWSAVVLIVMTLGGWPRGAASTRER